MILAQPEIRLAVESGLIRFDPLPEPDDWNGASVNLRLGTLFTKLHGTPGLKISVPGGRAAMSALSTTMDLPSRNPFGQLNSLCLEPGEFVLAMTHEKVTLPNNVMALLEGRSSYARLGLSMHQTAPWIQPGWSGRIVLEIKNQGPMRVELTPLLDRPCQITFFPLSSTLAPTLAYGAKPGDAFANQTHPLGRATKEAAEPSV